ncbi:MAG: hypothetical protein DLM62_06545 [Pseudonocardiales bacterium]|nr:MAG: hypothetical protein DLM62_06545 [Pseudonocardiales bacterium]
MAATWLAMFVSLYRHPGLLRPGVTVAFFRSGRLRAVAGIFAAFAPVLARPAAPVRRCFSSWPCRSSTPSRPKA